MNKSPFIDTHAHFNLILEDAGLTEEALLDDCFKAGLSHAVQIAISEETLQWSYDFAVRNKSRGILFSLGLHPSSHAGERELGKLEKMVESALRSHPGLIFGIGECGLDFYRMRQSKSMQEDSFRYQILCAKKYNLPLIIHSRDAMADTMSALKELEPARGIMHCFQGGKREAKHALDCGMMISFAGNLTYKNAHDLHESAAYVPLDRLLLETDAPFLTPVPLRGRKNRPENVEHTYRFMARLRNIPLEKLAERISGNFTDMIQRPAL
ncbi:MAG: TatD family hydrolase [Spirochaetales bacterium]|nr:TatD family hydrolase [Spirochaetales bacterium]